MVRTLTLLLAACASKAPEQADSCALTGAPLLVAATSDYTVGALAAVEPGSACVADELSSTWPDSLVRVRDGTVFVLGRGQADAIRTYADCCFAAPEREIPLPPGTNAHDLAVVGDRWLVSGYGSDELLVLDADGDQVATVDLTPWADADGLPEADQITVDGTLAYVALQNLDEDYDPSYWPPGDGRVLAVDPALPRVVDEWSVGADPKLYEHPFAAPDMVILTGVFGTPDGALEILDPAGSLTTVRTEEELGFDLYDYAEVDGRGVVLGVDFDDGSTSHVSCVDWATGSWKSGPTSPSWFDDVVAGDGVAWIGARLGADTGLFRLDPVSCAILDDPWLEPSLEPYSIAWLP